MIFTQKKKFYTVLIFIFFISDSKSMICDRGIFDCEDYGKGALICKPPLGNFTCNIENHDWDGKGVALVTSLGTAAAVDCLKGSNSIIWRYIRTTCSWTIRCKIVRCITDKCNQDYCDNQKSLCYNIKKCCSGYSEDCNDCCNKCIKYSFNEVSPKNDPEAPKNVSISEKTLISIERMLGEFEKRADGKNPIRKPLTMNNLAAGDEKVTSQRLRGKGKERDKADKDPAQRESVTTSTTPQAIRRRQRSHSSPTSIKQLSVSTPKDTRKSVAFENKVESKKGK